jgi:hypothetical protein
MIWPEETRRLALIFSWRDLVRVEEGALLRRRTAHVAQLSRKGGAPREWWREYGQLERDDRKFARTAALVNHALNHHAIGQAFAQLVRPLPVVKLSSKEKMS